VTIKKGSVWLQHCNCLEFSATILEAMKGRWRLYFGGRGTPALDFSSLTSVGKKQYMGGGKIHDVKEIENMFVATINLLKIRKCVSSEDQKGSE